MVTLHKPPLYDLCEIKDKHLCADGIERPALVLSNLGNLKLDPRLSPTEKVRELLGEMRICLVWYGQVQFPHQPHINYIEYTSDTTTLYCDSSLITDKQVALFV